MTAHPLPPSSCIKRRQQDNKNILYDYVAEKMRERVRTHTWAQGRYAHTKHLTLGQVHTDLDRATDCGTDREGDRQMLHETTHWHAEPSAL